MTAFTLEDRFAIYELIAQYSFRVDNYDGEAWAELFLPEGRLVGADIELVGKAGFIGQTEKLLAGPYEYRHVITNIFIEQGASAGQTVADAYGTVAGWAAKPAAMAIFVEDRFNLVKRDGQWKIAELRVHMPYADEEATA